MSKLKGAALTAWKRKHPQLVERWGKSKKKRRKASNSTPKKKKKEKKTMAKKKRKKSSKRRGGSRGGGGGLFSLSKSDMQKAAAAAGGYAYLATVASEKPADYEWFTKLPVIESVGRAATVALISGVAYKQGIAKKYTKPLAIGVGFVALVNFARRGFKLYEGSDGSTALGNDDGSYLSGDVDLEHEAA